MLCEFEQTSRAMERTQDRQKTNRKQPELQGSKGKGKDSLGCKDDERVNQGEDDEANYLGVLEMLVDMRDKL